MKKLLFIFIVLSILPGLASCSQSAKKNDALSLAVENIKKPLTLMNERFTVYENALESVDSYIIDPIDKNLQNAKKTCTEAIGSIAELPVASMSLSDSDLKKMMDIGINTADYRVPFDYANYYKNENIQTLTFILYYLNQAPALNDVLEYLIKFNIDYQTMSRKIEYIGVNDLFCKFSGGEIDSFKDKFLPSLTAFSKDKLLWDTDSASLEAKANKLLSDAEADTGAYAEFMGDQYTALLEAQSNFKDMLMSAGYDKNEADKIISDIDKISEQAQKLP